MKTKWLWLPVSLCCAFVVACGESESSNPATPGPGEAGVDRVDSSKSEGSGTAGAAPKLASGVKEREFEIAPGVKMTLVWCPPGKFMMGSPDGAAGASLRLAGIRRSDETRHEVTLTKGFWIGKYEVTQQQWVAVMGENPSPDPRGRDIPVNTVSWEDAQAFLGKLGGGYRLPTEAEWEYACRAGEADFDIRVTPDEASFTDRSELQARFDREFAAYLDGRAWYSANSEGQPHPVGQKKANAWGIHDMRGNVWEWCQDWDGDYAPGAATDPTGPAGGSYRVYRGGCWYYDAAYCRSANRSSPLHFFRGYNWGFRVAVSSTP